MSAQTPNENPSEADAANVKTEGNKSRQPIVMMSTLASIIIALILAALSVKHDCTGVAYNSEQCLWARSLYLLTSGIFFVFTWPVVLFVVWLAREIRHG